MRSKKTNKPSTVGAQYLAEATKEAPTRDPIELQRAMQEKYVENLLECTQNARAQWPGKDFFVVVITKRERLMEKLFRLYYVARLSCPSPEYDQSVYWYRHADEYLEFLWTVPDKQSCFHIRENALEIHPDERQLLQFVLDFFDGTLITLSKRMNKEIE